MQFQGFQPKLFDCIKEYNKSTFVSDLLAGVIVGIVALPLAIAFGIASGATPEAGILTAIVAGLLFRSLEEQKFRLAALPELLS